MKYHDLRQSGHADCARNTSREAHPCRMRYLTHRPLPARAPSRLEDYAATTTPLLDWAIFMIGVFLSLGAASILALGYWRAGRALGTAWLRREIPPPVSSEPARDTASTWAEMPRLDSDEEDEVRVTRVR